MKNILVSCTLLAFSAWSVTAQPVPKLNSASPDWLPRGQAVEVKFAGDNLDQVTNLIFSGDGGLSAARSPQTTPHIRIDTSAGGISTTQPGSEHSYTARLTLASGASLRTREVRAVGPYGVSNPVRLNFGSLPEVAQQGPNHSLEQAQRIELPVALSGRIQETAAIDYYRFSAKQGQHLIFDVEAFRLGSPLDSSLAILDAEDKELVRNEDYSGLDSFIDFPVPRDGDYLIQLRDFRYQGGPDFKYRLLAGALPYITSFSPLGGQRGRDVTLELQGFNLAGAEHVTLHLDDRAPGGPQEIRLDTPMGVSNPILFDVGGASEIAEKEPNNATNQANEVSVPASINGRIGAAHDVDLFKFKSGRDQRLVFEVEARRFGSPLDSLLTLLDAEGKILARNDDALGADARIDYDKFKKGQEYIIGIRDLLEHGGPTFNYRLTIRRPQPDFTVKFFPDTPRLRRGGRSALRCELAAENGFSDTVRLTLNDLPPGVFAEPLLLSPSVPASGLLVLSAAPDARLGSFPITLLATGRANGKSLTRAGTPLDRDRPVKQAFLTILDAAPFTLEAGPLDVVLEQDRSATVDVLVQRRAGFTAPIKLSVEGFSAGREPATRSLEVSEVTLDGDATQGQLKLKARLDSEIGTRTFVVKGEALVRGYAVDAYSQPVPLSLSQIPFTLSPTLTRLSVAALPPAVQSAAREAVFTVKADRRMGFTQPIALQLEGVPEGITATVEKIAADSGEASIKLVATDKAPTGKTFKLSVTGTGTYNDRTYRQKAASVNLSITAPVEDTATVVAHAGNPAHGGTSR